MKTINIKLVFWILALGLFCCFLFILPNKPIIAFAEEENSTNDIMTASMQEDIQTYGLYTYEEFCLEVAEIPENIFEAFNGEYLKVSVGKGLINVEELLALIERYQVFFI